MKDINGRVAITVRLSTSQAKYVEDIAEKRGLSFNNALGFIIDYCSNGYTAMLSELPKDMIKDAAVLGVNIPEAFKETMRTQIALQREKIEQRLKARASMCNKE